MISTTLVLLAVTAACPRAADAAIPTAPPGSPLAVHWRVIPPQREFFVALRETVPNGPRLQSAQRTVPEAPLPIVPSAAAALTKVSVSVTAQCEGGVASTPVRVEALNDRRARCAPPSQLAAAVEPDGFSLSWAASAGAGSYRLTAQALTDGCLRHKDGA